MYRSVARVVDLTDPALNQIRGVLLEPEVRPAPMVISEIRAKDATNVFLAEDDHVVETLAANGSDQSLHIRALPGTQRAGDRFRDPHESMVPTCAC